MAGNPSFTEFQLRSMMRRDAYFFSSSISGGRKNKVVNSSLSSIQSEHTDNSYFSNSIFDTFSTLSSGYSSSSSSNSTNEYEVVDKFELFPDEPHFFFSQISATSRPSITEQVTGRFFAANDESLVWDTLVISVIILKNSPSQVVKAVEFANVLKKWVGRKQLTQVKELFGGLLLFLEGYPQVFCVKRVPKKDTVQLTCDYIACNEPHLSFVHTPKKVNFQLSSRRFHNKKSLYN